MSWVVIGLIEKKYWIMQEINTVMKEIKNTAKYLLIIKRFTRRCKKKV